MSERRAFEAALRADRYDEATRRVFADWLDEHGFDDEALAQRQWSADKERSIEYLEGFAQDVYMTYDELVAVVRRYHETGQYHCLPFDTPDRVFDEGETFWAHVERAIGLGHGDGLPGRAPFRCAC